MRERVAVVGLGYVGLPLLLALYERFEVVGYDCSAARVQQVAELHPELPASMDPDVLGPASVYLVAVPTPVDEAKVPDLGPLLAACDMLAPHLCDGDLVVFESTVYPGCVRGACVPRLAAHTDAVFEVGYSPERINPGDERYTLRTVVKVIAADSAQALARMRNLYGPLVDAGLHEAPSIEVAEAAKVFENVQRDVNIALVNELAELCWALDINTQAVLEAAGTKWNFLPFRPGLVGGHCVSVDPYYLAHRGRMVGIHTELTLAARRINDGMADSVVRRCLDLLRGQALPPPWAALVLGLTFKPNCEDARNSQALRVVAGLEAYGLHVDTHDPYLCPGVISPERYDLVVLAVPHRQYLTMNLRFALRPCGVLFDVCGATDNADGAL